MLNDAIKNADRFLGMADVYEEARPELPLYPVRIIERYLKGRPDKVIDLGCGTGLSTLVWRDHCGSVVGIEPNPDMLSAALKKQAGNVSFIKAFSHDTGLPEGYADAVVCSQSFHWMEPVSTLAEVNRILKPGGIFAAIDCDWPPVSDARAEGAYRELFTRVEAVERSTPELTGRFKKWDKKKHLENLVKSGYFRFAREIVFSNTEPCTAERFVRLARSQGGLQGILKYDPGLILPTLEKFEAVARDSLGQGDFEIDFCYRMRMGMK
jgi:ubiquinone/menaquinone biosynthesis C-methylase UbiE